LSGIKLNGFKASPAVEELMGAKSELKDEKNQTCHIFNLQVCKTDGKITSPRRPSSGYKVDVCMKVEGERIYPSHLRHSGLHTGIRMQNDLGKIWRGEEMHRSCDEACIYPVRSLSG
jgi:hypothetical protein